jgi:lysophospholipase
MYLWPILSVILHLAVCVRAQGSFSTSYAPTFTNCTTQVKIRSAHSGLSFEEKTWRNLRLPHVVKSLSSYLENANIPGFNTSQYLAQVNVSSAPIAGLAIAGGGSQSGMGGLGLWQAFDGRYAPAVQAGTGGLVQCLSYLSGLSGGGMYTVMPL